MPWLAFFFLVAACDRGASTEAAPSATVTAAPTAVAAPTAIATSAGPEPTFPAEPPLKKTDGPAKTTFAFAPPLDPPFSIETVRKKEKSRGSAKGPREVQRTVVRVTVTREGEGYLWRVAPVSFSVHGQPTTRIDELVAGFEVAYRLDDQGRLLEVKGYDDVAARAEKMLSPKDFRGARAMLVPETLRRSREQEWNGRVGDLVGQTIVIGEPHVTRSQVALFKGSTVTHGVARGGPWLECSLGTCLRVEVHQSTDAEALAKKTGVAAEKFAAAEEPAEDPHEGHGHQAHEEKKPGAPGLGYEVHAVRVVDPKTSMPVWERLERVIDIGGMGRLSDETVSVYDYSEAKP